MLPARARSAWNSLCRIALLVSILLLLAACTANWQAPLETRGGPVHGKGAPAVQSVTTQAGSLQHQSHYKVRSGDTLYSIAWRSQNDYRSLASWNHLGPPYTIYVGQILRLSAPAANSAAAQQTATSKSTSSKKGATPSVSTSKPKSTQTAKKSALSNAPSAKPAPVKKTPSAPPPEIRPVANNALRWMWPAQGQVVSGFQSGSRLKQGIKIKGEFGSTVKATEAGKVVYSGSGLIGYGRLIIVKHNDTYLSAYGHNSKLLVQQGQQVTRGQGIAELGRANDGQPLLHFEIRKDGKPVNPVTLLPRR